MIVVLGFYKRKPGLTLEQFHHHWREIHGPMIANNPACREHIRRYVQHQFVRPVPGVNTLEYDGFSESWYDSLESYKQMRADPRFQLTSGDTAEFVDIPNIVQVIDEQVVQIGNDHAQEWMSAKVA